MTAANVRLGQGRQAELSRLQQVRKCSQYVTFLAHSILYCPPRAKLVNTCQKNNHYFKKRYKISSCPSNKCTIDGSVTHATCPTLISFYSKNRKHTVTIMKIIYDVAYWCLHDKWLFFDSSRHQNMSKSIANINYSPLKYFRWVSL